MPRTSKLESPGCPPIRALTCDVLGLVKVIEARGKEGEVPEVVERWGEPDSSKCVLAASIDDRKIDALLAVARKSGLIEVLSPINGDIRFSIPNVSQADGRPEDDAITGLHLFKKRALESSSRTCSLLTCTLKGHARLRSAEISKLPTEALCDIPPTAWDVCSGGQILCSAVDGSENYAVFGGKGVEVNVWDLDKCTKLWTAKSPPKDSLGIFTPTLFTCATFFSGGDHSKFVAGTGSHQVRLYDISAQRRPVMSFDFRETPIKAVADDPDGHTIYIGNGSGDLASFDIRTGKQLGCFVGKCSGSIKSIVRHPDLPVIASCGLDCYLRIWDIKSRQLLSAVFLKQHLTNVVFDSNFTDKAHFPPSDAPDMNDVLEQDDNEELLPVKQKKTRKERSGSEKVKSKKKRKSKSHDMDEL